jgi:hypothetical protein
MHEFIGAEVNKFRTTKRGDACGKQQFCAAVEE